MPGRKSSFPTFLAKVMKFKPPTVSTFEAHHPNTTMSFGRLFSSDRLVYRALENTDKDKQLFYDTMSSDPSNLAQSSAELLRPLTSKASDDIMSNLADALLAITICCPVPPDAKGTVDTSGSLTPIVWLTFN